MKSVIREKIAAALELDPQNLTPRSSVHVPSIANKAKAVIGMRRAGKTSFLYQQLRELRATGIAADRLVYFNFEDERLAGMGASELDLILEEYYLRHPAYRQHEKVWFFFDEIQTITGWERFTRRILDSENVELYLSGSSASLLSREVATSMRGRAVESIVYPFSFAEFIRHGGGELPDDPKFLTPRARSFVENTLREYLVTGGFPEAHGSSVRDRRQLLQGYVDVVILRDVMERHRLTNLPAIRWLVRQLLANAGGGFSANRFHKDLQSQKIPSSVEGLLEVFAHLEDAFLIHGVRIEAGSERKRQVNPVKAYPIDPGLIPVFDRTGRENLGHALENAVLIELLRRGAEVTWVRTPGGFEVDFLARYPDQTMELIQVCAGLNDAQTHQREVRALQESQIMFPKARARLLTLDSVHSGLSVSPGETIDPTPVWEWLLKN